MKEKTEVRFLIGIGIVFILFGAGLICGWIGGVNYEIKNHNPEIIRDTVCMGQNYNLSEWEIMILAIAHLETGGNYNPEAKNMRSTATGIMQQLEIYVIDCNRIVGEQKYTLEDRKDPEKVLEMFEIIQGKYNPEQNIRKAIWRHSSGFASENILYRDAVYRQMENIRNYENFREIIVNYAK